MLFTFFFMSNPESGNHVMLALKFNSVRLNVINNKNQRRRKKKKEKASPAAYRMNARQG